MRIDPREDRRSQVVDLQQAPKIENGGLVGNGPGQRQSGKLGYRVTPQVKSGAYRIDMVVEGANDTRLAIECDGDEFHGPDRWPADMQRQRILERAGWVFWRCFASTWSMRRDDVLAELRARLHGMGIEPLAALERTSLVIESRNWPPASTGRLRRGG